jgi:periplasmic divalent cation tolerance protein
MYIMIYVTVPKNEAKDIAKNLLEKKLVACVNIISVDSLYFWQGELNEDKEELLIIKSKQKLFDKIEKEIKNIHPYEIPEIIATPIISGSKEYLEWIDESVKS